MAAPARLAKMYPTLKPECWKCKDKKGTFFNMWWQCVEVKKYWEKIQRWIFEMTKYKSKLEPETFLLGMIKGNLSREKRYLTVHTLTAARIILAQNWKNELIPPDKVLIQKIMDCAELDKFTMELKGKEDREYYAVWERWYKWIKNKDKDNK
uniref:Uncharacterized protein n=1 Tax=Micrurus paraensis TaxID=1970185 RepID=A0A2D4KMN7_9SAUR